MNHAPWNSLCRHLQEIALLESSAELLGWDERTMLPPKGGPYRAEQLAFLSGLIHQRRVDPRVGQWLDQLADHPDMDDPRSDVGTTVRQVRRVYEKQRKLPQQLVEELARSTVTGQQTWAEARKNNDFAAFLPVLEHLIALVREKAQIVGYDETPYDALLDDFEPEMTTREAARVLQELRASLVPLIEQIAGSRRTPPIGILQRHYPRAAQEAFGRRAAEAIGFDFQRGRLDVTDHPFCASLGPADCRITTRYDEHFLPSALFGILHEAGHGIYDQGLCSEHYGLPPGQFVSLGIHESQSRMWENLVGRSRSFWQYFFPHAQQAFPDALGEVSLEDFYFAVNRVQPSLIRVEADEATYNLHIVIRFELELALLEGQLLPSDLPEAWRDKYQAYLGITPDSDALGVLQDVHWSAALIGYFPTYALGNLYAAQFFEAAQEQLGDLSPAFSRGEFIPLRQWLNQTIHQQGQRYSASELVERVTGRPLSHEPLLHHLRNKLLPLYATALP